VEITTLVYFLRTFSERFRRSAVCAPGGLDYSSSSSLKFNPVAGAVLGVVVLDDLEHLHV
jgi:hypothetical protein